MNKSRVDHVLYHIQFMCPDLKYLLKYFVWINEDAPPHTKGRIYFRMSTGPTDLNNLIWLDEIPVIYPLNNNKLWYSIDQDKNLVFHHDILRSAFFLLSAQQETTSQSHDALGRFMYFGSAQYELGIVYKPIVNYYFNIIAEAISEFCGIHQIKFERQKPFSPFAFFLSHDIDRIYFHHPREVAGRFLQLLGLREKAYPANKLIRILAGDLIHVWKYKTVDPWWTFGTLASISQRLNLRSTFFFLPKTKNRLDSRYSLANKRIAKKMETLESLGFEIGFHIPIGDGNSNSYNYLSDLSKQIKQHKIGVRRHFLKVKYPSDYCEDVRHNMAYDSSFGFSETEGFRNSYCLPFKPYDFEKEQTIDYWVVPLVAMDITLLLKKRYSFDEITNLTEKLIAEVSKFGGVYSLLWHNCRFDEVNFSGISEFYSKLLEQIMQTKPVGITGFELVDRIDSLQTLSLIDFDQIPYQGIDI